MSNYDLTIDNVIHTEILKFWIFDFDFFLSFFERCREGESKVNFFSNILKDVWDMTF